LRILTNDLEEIKQILSEKYGGKIRIRVCGICEQNDKFLLINHKALTFNDIFWTAPGGGVEFGESIEHALKREFAEETGLKVLVGDFLGIFEFIENGFHAIELFYNVKAIGGEEKLGSDPEMENNIFKEMKWMLKSEISNLKKTEKHKYFR
jgi:8-oxo-dGTP diphosphatase